jgi:hypothetical protein
MIRSPDGPLRGPIVVLTLKFLLAYHKNLFTFEELTIAVQNMSVYKTSATRGDMLISFVRLWGTKGLINTPGCGFPFKYTLNV